jgi:hypothetical protein
MSFYFRQAQASYGISKLVSSITIKAKTLRLLLPKNKFKYSRAFYNWSGQSWELWESPEIHQWIRSYN